MRFNLFSSDPVKVLRRLAEKAGNFGHFESNDVEKTPDENSKLWVVFSHIDVPPGKFAQSNVFQHLAGHKLFLNCVNNCWYTNGVPGISSDLDSTIGLFRSLVDEFDVTFVGHSMGAYLSALCGLHFPKSKFISTSPELKLGQPNSRSEKHGITRGSWPDILSETLKQGELVNGLLLFGAYDPVDASFLGQLDYDACASEQILEVWHHHGVTEYFTSNGVYLDVLNFDAQIVRDLKRRCFLRTSGQLGTNEQNSLFSETYSLTQNNLWAQALECSKDIQDWSNPGWQELLAKIHLNLNDLPSALLAAEQCYQFQPDVMQFIDTYATICVAMNENRRLCHLLDRLTAEQRVHKVGQRIRAMIDTHSQGGLPAIITSDMKAAARGSADEEKTTLQNFDDNLNVDAIVEHSKRREHRDVLALMAEIDASVLMRSQRLCRLKGVALLNVGDKSEGRRLIMKAVNFLPATKAVARTLITSAVQLRDTVLLETYFDYGVGYNAREDFVNSVAKASEFVSDPLQIGSIIAELIVNAPKDTKTLKRIAKSSCESKSSKVMTKKVEQILSQRVLSAEQSLAFEELQQYVLHKESAVSSNAL